MNKPKIILQKNQKIRLFFKVPKEEVLVTMKIRIDLNDTKPKKTTHLVGKKQPKPQWFCHFCGGAGHTCPNYFKLQASNQATKSKVCVPKAQDPMRLIHELVKAFNLSTNFGVDQQSHVSRNSNLTSTSKKVWMQKTQHK